MYPATGGNIYVGNQSWVDSSASKLRMFATNGSGIAQNSYMATISTTGAAVYSPQIAFGLQSGSNAYAEEMRLTTIGLGISSTAPAYPLDVVGDIRTSQCLCYNASTLGTCTSDERIKKDIRLFDLGLQELLGIQPKYFKYNGLGGEQETPTEQMGVIAQEVEKVAPSLISTTEVKLHPEDQELTTIKKVNYGAFLICS